MAYPEAVKAKALAALAANGGNFLHTAEQIGVPRSTLMKWAKGVGVNSDVTKGTQKARGNMADALEDIVWRLIEHGFKRDKIETASVSQIATATGIGIDKMRLLREQPPPATEAEKSVAESLRTAALAMVEMARASGKELTQEQAEAKIAELQLRQSSNLASEAIQ